MTKQVSPKFQGKATLCKGKYVIESTDRIVALLGATQRDPKVYGADANEFKPERMLADNFKNLPNAAWKVSCSLLKIFPLLKFYSPLEPGCVLVLDEPLLGKKPSW
jgi:cytochrome P450/NADPH-cytochrome P450 reductase